MECEIPRDRVYSLLSVCAEKRGFEIDYSSTAAGACINFLLSMGDLTCLCAPGMIANSMGVSGGLSVMTTYGTNRQYFLEIEVRGRVMTSKWKACSNQGFHTSFEFGTPGACCPDLLGLLRYVSCWQSPSQSIRTKMSDQEQDTSTRSGLGDAYPAISVPTNNCISTAQAAGQYATGVLDTSRAHTKTLPAHLGPDISSMGYDEVDGCWYASDFTITVPSSGIFIIRILLPTLAKFNSLHCPDMDLCTSVLRTEDEYISMSVKRVPWRDRTANRN